MSLLIVRHCTGGFVEAIQQVLLCRVGAGVGWEIGGLRGGPLDGRFRLRCRAAEEVSGDPHSDHRQVGADGGQDQGALGGRRRGLKITPVRLVGDDRQNLALLLDLRRQHIMTQAKSAVLIIVANQLVDRRLELVQRRLGLGQFGLGG